VTVRERIFSIKLLSKQEEYADYFKELGLFGETKLICSEASKRVKRKEITNEKGGVGIC
jgi:hypothetical protein